MFDEKIKEIEANIGTLNADIASKTQEVKNALEANDLEKARSIKAEITEAKNSLETAKADLELYKTTAEKGGAENIGGKEVKNEEVSYRDSVNEFIRSKGSVVNDGLRLATKDEVLVPMNEIVPTTDGVKKVDAKPVSSEEILYTPQREVKTVVDLKPFTTVYQAKKASGKYPVLQRATTKMVSVAELEKNPALAKPEFKGVDWKVETYRGAIPVSQESIDDADVDLLALISESVGEIKVNTTNYAMAEAYKTFAPKTIANLDDLKKILNVDLDPAYQVSLTATQNFYNLLDTLKDNDGRYLLQDSIISPSGKVVLGNNINVVSDEFLGAKGDAKAFVGDSKRGVLFVDRLELGLRWAENEIYGQYLQAVMRFDVVVADAKAGFFVTFTPAP